MKRTCLLGSLALTLAGCGTMSGLDGQGKFSCKAPDGIACASLSGVYANALQNNLPGQARSVESPAGERSGEKITRPVPSSGEPIRSTQKVRRVWLAPWEDDEEVLHDQAYVYLVVDPGRWQLEHTRRNAGDGYRPVMPPRSFAPAAMPPGERPTPTLGMERANPAPAATSSLPMPGRERVQPLADGE